MSSKDVCWVNIELECSSRKRRTLFYDCRERTLDGKAASQAVLHSAIEGYETSCDDRLDSRKPLLIAFHGGSGQPEQMEKLTGFISLAKEQKFFVAYPEGLNRGWNDGREVQARREIDDVEFLIKLVDRLRQSRTRQQAGLCVRHLQRGLLCAIPGGACAKPFGCRRLCCRNGSRTDVQEFVCYCAGAYCFCNRQR